MAASNYLVGELLDRFGFSPQAVTIGVGVFFLLPGLAWFATERLWNREQAYRTAGAAAPSAPPEIEDMTSN